MMPAVAAPPVATDGRCRGASGPKNTEPALKWHTKIWRRISARSASLGCFMSPDVPEYFFRTGRVKEANAIVKEFHYSGRIPTAVAIVGSLHMDGGLFGGDGPMVGACYFSQPATRWGEPVLELTRLVRTENEIPLSRLVSLTVKQIKKQKLSDLLVSFADSTVGHHGGIYRACSWNYAGKRAETEDGMIINGTFYPGRTCNAKFGTRSFALLSDRFDDIEPHRDLGKHLYWKPLNRQGKAKAKRLELQSVEWKQNK